MADMTLPEGLLNLMKSVDTPTVCNAIEVAQGKRGFNNYTKRTMHASDAEAPAMVGFARTAKIAGLEPPTETPDVIRARRMDYFRHMASGDGPTVAVVEDIDGDDAVSAWWGGVHTAVHKGLGMEGAVTNGVCAIWAIWSPDFQCWLGQSGQATLLCMCVNLRRLSQSLACRSPTETSCMQIAMGRLWCRQT